jgi:hypothetical protein
LVVCILIMQFRLINAIVSNVESWSDMSTATATVITAAFGFFTLTLHYYFKLPN